MKYVSKKEAVLSALFSIFFLLCVVAVNAQTTEFTYQGRLLDNSLPPTGNYDFQFSLWDTLADGTQIGTTQTITDVAVTDGIFTVKLDFGTTAFVDGSARFLEIEVKPAAGGTFTTLTPRQAMTSAPHSIRSLSTASADSLSAQCVNCVTSAQIESIDGAQITGTLPVTTVPTGSENYIQNAAVSRGRGLFGGQPAASFDVGSGNISGNLNVGGLVGIGTTTPQSKLSVVTSGAGYGLTHTNGTVTVGSFLTAGSGWLGTRSNHPLNLFTNDGASSLHIATTGEVGVRIVPQAGWNFEVGGNVRFNPTNGTVNFSAPNGETGMTITPLSGNRADFRFNGSIITIAAGTGASVPGNSGITVKTDGNVGVGTLNPTTKLEVAGTLTTSILHITAGSDLAENFEVSGVVKPGMIVAINPNNPEKLVLARGAYNRRVAGIVSGANNLSAGMVLPNLDQKAASMPVALSGRVWVYADATKNPIIAGDLLTTAAIPGHAMKVTNYKRANGAVIGKALTSLKSGTGLVLVLVNLQ